MNRAIDIINRATRLFCPTPGGEDFERVKAHGLARRDGKHVLLNLDTEKDEMVAKLYRAAGCTYCVVEGRYCRHTDETGKEYFYKIDTNTAGRMPIPLLEKACQCLRGMQVDASDGSAAEEAVKKMVVDLRSKKIASFVYGTRVMSRKEVLRDFDRMEDWQGITIFDKGLEKEYYPRPTSRALYGYPAPGVVEMYDEGVCPSNKKCLPCAKMSKTRLVPEPVGINSAAPSIPHNP